MKAITMLRLYTVLATGGIGLALALDSALAGYTPTAVVFTVATMILLGFGWFDLRASIGTKSQTDILRRNIDWLIAANAKRSCDAAVSVQALLSARAALHDGMGREAMIEMIDDALAEYHDPALAVRLCVDWLTDIVHNANKHWWTDPATGADLRNERYIVPTKLMLTVSEIAEAMEADRKQLPDDKLPQFDGLTVEMADALFRIFDLAGAKRLPMGVAASEKFIFNITRPDHQASARMAIGGKAY
ncbi:hypothetical protein G6321_00020480 [Bradyrhizobium barranii subsp. barranii]|uniref:Uncharacterized protein n=1 Tax=Bradyrhizobium barranii subsp. barranii TaxID=2823807 RepID=A0A7Z0QLQ5_9BRAD|nr:hypothetical protein [Bradyrhizobium barranii]UGX97372.1 hypothetical protein G6321_00020480 [Bradyrhizobium barranii subsp. barranii]